MVRRDPGNNPHGRTVLDYDGFWMPSYCPVGLRYTWDRCSVMVEAHAVEWRGGRTVTCYYLCPCCDHEWSEDDWPVVMLFGVPYSELRRGRAALSE